MPSLQELLAQKAELDKAIAETQRAERTHAIAKVRALMAEHGLKVSDLSARTPAAPRATREPAVRKAPIKFRNTATGDVWSGRGAQPKWLREQIAQGRKLADFAV
jgi:DNA-binding protein H-NS